MSARVKSPVRWRVDGALKSALRERSICGLRGWDSPVPPTPVKDQTRGKPRPATGSVGRHRFAQTCT